MGWQGRGIFAMPFSPLAKTVRHDSVRLQRGPSEPALEQLELLKRQDLRNRDRRRTPKDRSKLVVMPLRTTGFSPRDNKQRNR